MRKPRHILSFFGLLLSLMGITSLLFKANTAIALILLIFSGIFFLLSLKKSQIEKEILSHGSLSQGKILKIKNLYFLQWNNHSPYVVHFSYNHNGTSYKGKSNLVWDIKNFYENQSIDVFVDPYNPENNAVNF